MVREDVPTLIEEVRVVALEAALLGGDWTLVRKVACDLVDTANALPASDQEAADNLREIAKVLAGQSWKMASRRAGFKDGIDVKTKLGDLHQIRTAHLAGLRGRG